MRCIGSKCLRQDDLPDFRPERSKSWKTVLALWCALSTGLLFAKTPAGTVTGTVTTQAGAGIQHAKVIARAPGGQVVATVVTDDRGSFEFPPISPGTYRLEVEFPGQLKAVARAVVIKAGDHAVLDFVGVPSHDNKTQAQGNLLGPVTFYNHSEYQQGQLTDPSGGGGYSNAASAQAVKILDQYLAPPASAAAAGGGSNEKPASVDGPHEAELESSGSALLERKDYARAVEIFKKATALYPASERLQMGLGLSLFGAGKYPQAAGALLEAARLAPNDSGPVVMLAETLQFVDDPAAPSVLKRFSGLHPENARGHYAYGLSLWREFRVEHHPAALAGAEAEFRKAVELDPNDADAHLQLGVVYDEQKEPDRAIREYLTAIQMNPKLVAAHYRLAQDYKRLGEKGKAEAEFAQYEQLRGHTPP